MTASPVVRARKLENRDYTIVLYINLLLYDTVMFVMITFNVE